METWVVFVHRASRSIHNLTVAAAPAGLGGAASWPPTRLMAVHPRQFGRRCRCCRRGSPFDATAPLTKRGTSPRSEVCTILWILALAQYWIFWPQPHHVARSGACFFALHGRKRPPLCPANQSRTRKRPRAAVGRSDLLRSRDFRRDTTRHVAEA